MDVEQHILSFELILSEMIDRKPVPLTETEHQQFFQVFQLMAKDFERHFISKMSVKPTHVHLSSGRIDCFADSEVHMKRMHMDHSATEAITEFIVSQVVPSFRVDELHLVINFKKTENIRYQTSVASGSHHVEKTTKKSYSDVARSSSGSESRTSASENCSLQNTTQERQGYSSNSYKSNPLPADDRTQAQLFDRKLGKATFWLFVPSSGETVEKVQLIIGGRYVKMTQHEKQPLVWIAEAEAKQDSVYHYAVKSVYRILGLSVFNPTRKEEKKQSRTLLEHSIQRDLFDFPSDPHVLTTGYKALLALALEQIETEADLWSAVKDFESKHNHNMKRCLSYFALDLLKEFCRTSFKEIPRMKAVFFAYIISKFFPIENSFLNNSLEQDKCKMLLEGIQNSGVKFVNTEIEETMADTLVAIVKKSVGGQCTWLHFVICFYQTLSGTCLVQRKQRFSCTHVENIGKDVVARLLNSLDDKETYDELLLETLKMMKSTEVALEVLITVKRLHPAARKLLTCLRNYVCTLEKENLKKGITVVCLNEHVQMIWNADPSLLQQLAAEFENNILSQFEVKCVDTQHLLNLLHHESFFCTKESAVRVLHKAAKSETVELRSLFPAMARKQKFLDILKSDSEIHMNIARAWISAAKRMKPASGYNREWYDHVYKLLGAACDLQDQELVHKIEDLIHDYFSSSTKQYISNFSSVQDITNLARLVQTSNAVEERVLQSVCADLEVGALKLVGNQSGWDKDAHIKDLLTILNSSILFNEYETQKKVLEALAGSKTLAVHNTLLKALSTERYWQILEPKVVLAILSQWIATAKNYHCKEKAKQKKHSGIFVGTVYYLYEYLADLEDLTIPHTCQGVIDEIEIIVKQECEKLTAHQRLQLCALASELRLKAVEFLESHMNSIKSATPSKKELEVWLNRYAETIKLDFSSRSDLKVFEMILNHLNKHLENLSSNSDKYEFILSHSKFWLNLYLYKGQHERELQNHEVVKLMIDTIKRFSETVHQSTITLTDFQQLEGIIGNAVTLIETVSEHNGFLSQWEKLKQGYTDANDNYQLLSKLNSCFLQKLKGHLILKNDIEKIPQELTRIEAKLDPSSSCPMGQMNKRDFFLSQSDLLPIARILDPFKDLKTFVTLCRKCMPDINKYRTTYMKDEENTEVDISGLFDEESKSSEKTEEISAVEVAYYIEKKCLSDFKDWLKDVTETDTTLACAMKFGTEQISQEVKRASQHFEISVSEDVVSALEWLGSLKANSQKVMHIKKTLVALGLASSLTSLESAIWTFGNCLSSPQKVTIGQLAETMKELKNLLSETDDDWWALFEELSSATELIDFIRETLDDDFRNLIDAVEEQSEQTIDESTVSDLIRVKQFLQPIFRQTFVEPELLFECIQKSMQKEGKDMSKKISNCAHNVHGLKALYQHVANRGELTKEIINNAMKIGIFVWSLKTDESCCAISFTYRYTKQKGDTGGTFSYGSDELSDLRSRALLLSNSEKRDKDHKAKHQKDVLQNFVKAVDSILEITWTVTELHQLGHFDYRTHSHKMQSGNTFLPNLSTLLEGRKQTLDEWRSILDSSRQKYNSLNFLYCDQLSLMSDFLLDNCDHVSEQQIKNVLRFVHPGSTVKELRKHQSIGSNKVNTGQDKLALIGSTTDKVMLQSKVTRLQFPNNEKFSSQSADVNALVEPGTLYIAHLEVKSTKTIPILLALYANTTHHFPVPSEVLFCHELTTWEEILLMINRSTISPELHCISNVERLSSNLQTQLVERLGHLMETADNKYRLAIICRGAEHHSIMNYFSSYVHRLAGFDTASLQTCLQTTWPDVSMITSSIPGLGKTEYIRNLASEKGKRMKTVHISGPVSREILVTQLESRKLTADDILHLDVGEVDDPNFLDACLFEYIVLGCLCSGTKVVCLPTSFIAIEVANTVQDRLRDSLVVLSSFNRTHLNWTDYNDFLVSDEIGSLTQIVCNYLKAYDEGALDSTDIVLNGSKSIKPLPPAKCKELLRKHFCSGADLSYSVTEIFVNVFGDQLRKLSNSQFFRVSNLKAMLGSGKPVDVRSKLMKALLDVAKEFACRSVQACRSIQNAALLGVDAVQGNEKSHSAMLKLTQAELMVKRVNGMLQWADTNHLLVTFNGIDSQTVSALYRELSQVPTYVKELFNSQLRRDLPDLNNLSHQELQMILERVAGSRSQKEKSKGLDTTYALTPDNLLKMILILLRIRANIPVVIMGETGCGKTSLIRHLAQVCDTEFEHFSIHAGITVDMIKNTVLKCHDQCRKNPKTTIWLFLDEINTCDHLGLLTEIICHHSCFGKSLSKRLIFIAACNPYRLREEHQIMTAGLEGKVKTDSFSRLVYRVHPLPETMIDYVWDYGTLHKNDEKSYIKQMVSKVFPEAEPEWHLKEKIVDLLVTSQNFVRKSEKCDWCVSLRDVYRCQMLMTQFLNMLHEKLEHSAAHSKLPCYFNRDDEMIYFCAIVLALAHCYQSRLATTENRDEYWRKCAAILLGDENRFKELTEMVRYEQLDLLNRMVLPQGIAKNTALCENVFVILVCILNRIPIFLVGKPGCSKSLSVQLIKSNLRGKDSVDSYFQTLPNLYIVSYQGSESSTSEGIMKVFKKAEKYGEANKQHGVLPVVLLDEVGLAEASRFNPLKVLHGLLEPATGELPKVAVVGISNWSLDAAKMNRAIHLSRPDMDVQELFETGKSISAVPSSDPTIPSHEITTSDFESGTQINEKTLHALAEAYYRYQQEQLIKNFHGLRDYYSLIKYISRLLSDQENISSSCVMDELKIIQRGLLRNFGGTGYGVSEIFKLFSSFLGASQCPKWSIEEIIMDNLKDKLARHLMLITSGDSAVGILLNCLKSLDRNYSIIFGSKFEEDQTEDYSYRILSRIILCMETGSVLILKDLDTIYGSLYDMLNQNYTVVGKKKNCRIALGPYSNPMCQVHDDFRCIVLVDENKVNYSDPPFLNRFEKQILRFEEVIADGQKTVIQELEDWMDDFCMMPNLPFVKDNAFIGLCADTVPSLVYQVSQGSTSNENKIFLDCQDVLLWLVPPDAILRVTHSEFAKKSTEEMRSIQSRYFERPIHEGLSKFLSVVLEGESENLPPVFNKTSGLMMVVYTHSNIYIDLQKVLKHHRPLQVEKLGSFKSEKQLTKQIRQFFESDNRLLVLQCEPCEDGKHIPLAKFQLQELHQEYAKKSEKHVCIVLHMERSTSPAISASGQFSFLSGWQLAVIDTLEEQENFPLTTTLSMNISDILNTEFCPIQQCIQKRLVWAFTCTNSSYGERSMQEFSELITKICDSKQMLSCLAECILEHIKGSENWVSAFDLYDPDRWQVKVACDLRLLHSATSFTDALKQYLMTCVTTPLANLVYSLEKLSAWHSYFRNQETAAEIWKAMFWNCKIFRLGKVEIPQGPGSFKISHKPLNLQCPFSQVFIEKLCKWEELFKQDLLEAEKDSSEGDDLKTYTYLSLFEKYQGLFESDISILRELDILKLFEQEFINDICNCLSLGYVLPENDRIQVALWLIGIKSHSHHDVTPEVHLTESLLCLWRYEPLFHALLQLISECRPILPYSVEEMLSKTSSNKLLKEEISEDDTSEGFQSQNAANQVQSEEDFVSETSFKQLSSVNQKYVQSDEAEILLTASATEEDDFEEAFTAGKEEETVQNSIASKDKANESPQDVISESASDSDEDGIDKMLAGQNRELEEPPEPEFLAGNNDELSDTDDKENLIKVDENNDEQLGEVNQLNETESNKDTYENLEEELDESVDLYGSEDDKNDEWIDENSATNEVSESAEFLEIESGKSNENVKESEELSAPECISDEIDFDCDKLHAANTESIQDDHPDEGSSYCDVPEIDKREDKELNEGETKSLDEEVSATENETTRTDETSGLHPEEQLVHLLCKLLVPTHKVLKECGGFSGWHGRVCSMLSFCSSVSSYPVSFHALRIFNDLATVLFHCKLNGSKIEQFLVQLSEVVEVEDLENSLNSTAMFDRVFELYDTLEYEDVSEMDFQCFVCMYISRIIDINPETELLGAFLLKAAQFELPDKNLSHLEVLLNRVLLEVQSPGKTLFEVLKSLILHEGEDLASLYHLEAMDVALQKVDLKKSLFLILCIDVIQDTVMKTYAWENLDDVKSSANDLLFTFKTAVELIASSPISSLRVAAAVAFVKEFLQHMTEMIVYDLRNQSFTDHFVLYQNINTLLSIEEGKNFLLRQLKLNRSFEELKKLVTSLENVVPVLLSRTLPEDDLSLALGHKVLGGSCERNASLEASVRQLNSDDKMVREYLTKSNEEKELLCLTEAFLHALFLPNAIRPLTDSEKQVGGWLKGNATLIPHQLLNSLLQRTANVESFGAGLFKVTPEMTCTQLQQASFLLHLISVLVVKISLNQNNLLTECLVQSETIFKAKLNSLAMEKCENGTRPGSVNCSLVTCKCWSRLIFSGTCENCPICSCKWATVGVHEEEFLAKNLLPAAEECYERQSLAVEILRLFIDGSLLCSLALGSLNIEAVKAACEEISDRETCQILLESDFEKTWTTLKESLQLNPEEIGLFLHSVVDTIDIFRGNFNFHNTEQLTQKIELIETNIIEQFLQPSMYFKLKLYQRSISVTSPKVQQSILELPTEDCGEELPNWLTPLFRLVGKRTLADMKAQFYMSEKENDHPVIDTFFKKGQHLVLLRHLMPLMKWSQLCYQAINHYFSREDGKTLTLAKLILAFPELKENLKKTFDQFIESWEELCKEDNFSLLRTFDSSLPAQPHAEQVMICENSDSVIYKVLKALVHIQNMFLIELLSIAQSGKCPSLGFLKKNFSNMAAIKSVLLQNLKDDQVIVCEFENIESELTRFAQNNLIFGFGSQACYNFVKIEMELANMLSLGKTYIVVNETFPFVTYANEMFVACASVLREFKLVIPQKPLGQSVKDGIEEKIKNNRDFVNQMMRQTEILLCLAKKTGGSPDQTLKNYNQSWLKTLPGGFSEQNLVFEGEPLCLSHLVALYEFLENLQADAAIKSMHQEFRRPLPKAVEKELKDFADTNHIELSSIQVAFRRFIMRHLVNFDPENMNLDAPLKQWMAEPSLWPEGVKENGELEINKEGGTPTTIKTAFPQMLNLEHTFCALTYIGEIFEVRTKQRAKWLPGNVERKHVTGSASSATTKIQQGRQRAKGRIGKT